MTQFKGEIREVARLHSCPVCGAKPVLRKDSTKRFQVVCPECECRTVWTTKSDAIIAWYDMILADTAVMSDTKER